MSPTTHPPFRSTPICRPRRRHCDSSVLHRAKPSISTCASRSTSGRSQLLHRLRVLGISWGVPRTSDVRSTGTFRETWALQWEPELSVSIVEASRWGTTVESAAHELVLDRARDPDATLAQVVALLEETLLADLRDAIPELLRSIDTAAALDHDVAHLMAALPPLIRTLRYGDVRGTDLSSLAHVADALLVRICAGLPAAITGLDTDAADALRRGVDAVHAALALRDDAASTRRWLDTLTVIADRDEIDGILTGRTVRLLRDMGRIDEQDTAVRVSRALSIGSEPAAKARWIDGFVGDGALLLIHDRALLTLIDRWVSGLHRQDFVDVLPVLRRTFGGFEATERATLGAAIRGGAMVRTATPVDVERGRRATAATALILGV